MKPCLLLLAALPFQAAAFFVAPSISSSRPDVVVLRAARTNEGVSSRQQHLGNAFRSLSLAGFGAAVLAQGAGPVNAREKVEYLKEPTPEFEVRETGEEGWEGQRGSMGGRRMR